jgi:dTDP-4-dehydrorhamnose reductase
MLVTGYGMLGRRIAEAARRGGIDTTIATRRPACDTCVHWDIADVDAPAELRLWRPDYVVHTAALTDVDLCERVPALAWRTNVEGTKRVSDLACAVDARLVSISSDAVFDGRRGWYTDLDSPKPVNVYAKSKLEGEIPVTAYENGVVVRTNIVGPERLTAWIIDSARAGRPISVFTDVIFNPLDVFTLAADILTVALCDATGVVHFGADQAISKAEYARRVLQRAGLSDSCLTDSVQPSDEPLRARRPLNTTLVPSEWVQNDLGVRPLATVIQRSVDAYLNRDSR